MNQYITTYITVDEHLNMKHETLQKLKKFFKYIRHRTYPKQYCAQNHGTH